MARLPQRASLASNASKQHSAIRLGSARARPSYSSTLLALESGRPASVLCTGSSLGPSKMWWNLAEALAALMGEMAKSPTRHG
eukprot:5971934-Prymnesium_polylepis.1